MRNKNSKWGNHYKSAHDASKRQVRRRPYIMPIFGLLFGLLIVGGVVTANGNNPTLRPSESHVVFIFDGEKKQTHNSKAQTVGELIKELPLNLIPEDLVEPSADTLIVEDSFRINVYRARPVMVVDDGLTKNVILTAQKSPRVAAQRAGTTVYAEDKVSFELGSIKENIIGEKVVIDRATPVKLILYGQENIVRTHQQTVGELLKEKNVKPVEGDTLQPSLDTVIEPNMTVALIRNGIQVITVEETIAAPTQTVDDTSLSFGATAVRQVGTPGKRVVTYQVETKNGVEVSRKVLQQTIIQAAVPRVVAVGGARFTGSLETWLYQLRMCETRGNYQTNTGNGYYGAYQFAIRTWNSLNTGYERADLAPPSVQDRAVIANTNRSSGGLATQHPGCYKKLGLSQFPPSN